MNFVPKPHYVASSNLARGFLEKYASIVFSGVLMKAMKLVQHKGSYYTNETTTSDIDS